MDGTLIWILGALLACAAVCIGVLCVRVLLPMKKLSRLSAGLEELDAAELRHAAENIPGEPGAIARAVAERVAAEEADAALEEDGNAAAEERFKARVVDDICNSLLPRPLKNNSASMSFFLSGGMQRGTRRNCAFYDYFFLDGNTLCFAAGQVPGCGIAEALFSVVAQTTIRGRLRMGRSLIETMSDVNAQLYDLGGRHSAHVLVCLLNIMNGRLQFVNAGGSAPVLMRSEERYEWLDTPIYAPLGANESVTYRVELLRLNQGDRLFLYTSELGEMTNREGESFGGQNLLSVLNRGRSAAGGTDGLIRFVHGEAAAFCESGDDVLSSAAIALEYAKGNRDFIFTMVRAAPEEAPGVTEFMRKTLEDAGVSQKEGAKLILLTDELFSLCCRSCEAAAEVKLECAIQPEENTFHLRIFAPMGGRDPLQTGEDSTGGNAANYIRTHTRRASFEAGIERDMLEIVSDIM